MNSRRLEGINIRSVIIALVSLSIYLITVEAVLNSDFEIISSGDSEITYYTYLREPSLQDSGYSRGLKLGAFEYLVGDTKKTSVIRNILRYDYGKTNETGIFVGIENSSVINSHFVDFSGKKGISEYYAKGFFKNNRAISAWKKIRYDDLDKWNLGKSYLSDYIHVDASVQMDMEPGMSYDFRYTATAKNGTLELKDTTGWSNRTGARRTDWEQDALMKGESITLKNDLSDQDFNPPASTREGEWLPCCFAPPRAMVLVKGEDWPNKDQIMLLDCSCPFPSSKNETLNSFFSTSETIRSGIRSKSSTEDLKSITEGLSRTFEEGEIVEDDETVEENQIDIQTRNYLLKTSPSISNPSRNRSALYIFEIKNTGDARFKNTEAIEVLPLNMQFIASECWRGIENRELPTPTEYKQKELKEGNPTRTISNLQETLRWDLGTLEVDETIRLYICTEYEIADPFKIVGSAEGEFQDQKFSDSTQGIPVNRDLRDRDIAEDYLKYAPRQCG